MDYDIERLLFEIFNTTHSAVCLSRTFELKQLFKAQKELWTDFKWIISSSCVFTATVKRGRVVFSRKFIKMSFLSKRTPHLKFFLAEEKNGSKYVEEKHMPIFGKNTFSKWTTNLFEVKPYEEESDDIHPSAKKTACRNYVTSYILVFWIVWKKSAWRVAMKNKPLELHNWQTKILVNFNDIFFMKRAKNVT